MSTLGQNFEILVPPHGRDRKGRFFNDAGAAVAIGAPMKYALSGSAGAANDLDMLPAVVVAADEAIEPGTSGIAVYEYGPNAYAGFDTALTEYSDLTDVPADAAVQLISGTGVKVRLQNRASETFLNNRTYPASTIINLTGVAVGDLLQPNHTTTPNSTNGYWEEATTPANAWLKVTAVGSDYVEAQMLF